MPRNSKKAPKKPARFKTEADWLASAAGKRETERVMRRAIREGTVTIHPNGIEIEPTDPGVLEGLMNHALTSITHPVSLRIPAIDIAKAKRIAAKKGVGYQTVLKQVIHDGLRRA